MTKATYGSLPRGRRTRAETPGVPEPSDLSPAGRRVQPLIEDAVTRAGGRFASGPVPSLHVHQLADYFEEFASSHAVRERGQTVFHGRPGFWQALDVLYPLQDPNRWDRWRFDIIRELQDRGWRRLHEPRGSAWILPR